MSFRLRRGLDSDRTSIVFDEGELIYTTDTKKVFVGDGSTAGGVDIQQSGHNHDNRYYQKGEVDTLIQNLGDSQEQLLDAHTQDLTIHRKIDDNSTSSTSLWSAQKITNELAGKSDTNHVHDARYYTKTEIDSQVNTIFTEIDKGEVKVDVDDANTGTLIDKIGAGTGIVVFKDTSGSDNVLRVSSNIFLAHVNGILKPCYVDSNKSGKILTVETCSFMFAEGRVDNNEWIQIGHAVDADASYVMPFDGTIVGVTAHCEDARGSNKNIRLYVGTNEVEPNLITINGTSNVVVNEQGTNIDFSAGDRIRLRAGGGGTINDTVITLFVKWRVA